MSQPQVQQRVAATNGVGRRRADRDVGNARADTGFRSDSHNWRSSQSTSRSVPIAATTAPGSAHPPSSHFGSLSGSNNNAPSGINRNNSGERLEPAATNASSRGAVVAKGPLHDRLVFMAMCLIGLPVEVQARNGFSYAGILHNANLEKDGIILKMARLIRDGSVKGGKSEAVKEAARKPPQKQIIIHAKDFVQIIAKDVSLSCDALPNGRARENRAEIVTDAVLSQGRLRDGERELKPWKPDDEAPRPLGLESTFQSSWNRNWDQFETNKTLFGVETTFNEELYTTKLERGPQMREREREASRIAREIEGTATKNLHLAEERGLRHAPELEAMDEESRFSSVIRGREKIDVGEDGEDRNMDDRNEETFGTFTGAGGSSGSPSGSSVSAPLTGESESKPSRPSSADSTQTIDGPSQKDPLPLSQERRTSSIEKGEVAVFDSQADTQRERLRLRHLLVGDKSKRSSKAGGSPYHSPVGRGSPLLSPLVGDAASIQALNLDPSCPQVPEEVYSHFDLCREFAEFKLQDAAKKGKKQREEQVNELKSFSESLKKKELEPRSPRATAKSVAEPNSSSRHVPQGGGARPSGSAESKPTTAPGVPAGLLTAAQASAPPASALPIPMALGGAQLAGGSSPANTLVPKVPSSCPEATNGSGSSAATSAAAQSCGVLTHNGLPRLPPLNTNFGGPSLTAPSNSHPTSPTVSPSSSVSSVASGAHFGSKKSSLNPNAKEFKLNPNAKAFTPNFSSPRSASPMITGPASYIHAGIPPVAQMQGVPVGMNVGQYMQQPGQPSQFTQYNAMAAAAAVAANSPQYMQPPGSYVPGAPPVLAGQPGLKMQPHSQQQVVGPPYGQQQQQQQQQLRYPPQGHPMQPQSAFLHSVQYPQPMMYQQQQVMYIQPFPPGMMQGQPVPPPQGPLPPQPSQQTQQQKHRGGGIQQMHYPSGVPSFLPGQHHLQPQLPHLHNSLQPSPGGLPPASTPGVQPPQQGMVAPSGAGGSGNGVRGGGKVGSGGFSQL